MHKKLSGFKQQAKAFLFFLCVISFQNQLRAQFDHIDVYPGLEGNALFTNLQEGFTPLNLLTWSDTRDTMFSVVWGVNDSLSCIYTGHSLYMDPSEDPTQTVFLDGISDGINTEHVYPQSKGASDGNARINMHNLFPSRVDVNSARGSLPYGEINDSQTATWYFDDMNQSNIPQSNIDAYSEFGNGMFEPREEVKGDIARTVMYFYTIYRAEADAADPDFFDLQREDICNWHYADPVDQKEWEGNLKIASYQDGLANPFVLDCSLASRLYCEDVNMACQISSSVEQTLDASQIRVYPNPANDFLQLEVAAELSLVELILLNAHGQTLKNIHPTKRRIELIDLNPGIYILKCVDRSGKSRAYRFVRSK